MRILIITVLVLITMRIDMIGQEKVATFGGGCFWCTEAFFTALEGVKEVESGYSGGDEINPTYKEVCSGLTGHAEVIHITYDASKIEFEDLLEVFFATHDPTTLNRQGADVGTQYRSVIFYHDDAQKRKAEFIITELNKQSVFERTIVTELSSFNKFYKAEAYHQDYYANNPQQPYCSAVIGPKLEKFKALFKDKIHK